MILSRHSGLFQRHRRVTQALAQMAQMAFLAARHHNDAQYANDNNMHVREPKIFIVSYNEGNIGLSRAALEEVSAAIAASPMQDQPHQQQPTQQRQQPGPLITLDPATAFVNLEDEADGGEGGRKTEGVRGGRGGVPQQLKKRQQQQSLASRRFLDVTPLMLTPLFPTISKSTPPSPAATAALPSPGATALLTPTATTRTTVSTPRISVLSPRRMPNGDIVFTPDRTFFGTTSPVAETAASVTEVGGGVTAPQTENGTESLVDIAIAAAAKT